MSADESDEDRAARLRRRAEQLRATRVPRRDDHDEVTDEPDGESGAEDSTDEEHAFDAGSLGMVDDPDDSELLRRWAEEDFLESDSPRRNWSPVVAAVVILALIALVALAFRLVLDDDGTDGPVGPAGDGAEAPSVLDEEPPDLDELTADVTVPPGPEGGLTVADKGVTIVEDRFDPDRREGTFAVIVENPHQGWLAQGVQVDVQFLDAAGTAVGGDSGFVETVLPEQKVAVAALFFDAPTVPLADMAVSVDVARWRETEPVEGSFTTTDVTTTEAEFSGIHTTFNLVSSFPERLTDVGVTVVYRGAFGQVVGGSDTFVDSLEPGVPAPVEISLLANVELDQITATELYPTASFGFDPDAD